MVVLLDGTDIKVCDVIIFMERRASFRTKLKRAHSDQCIKKKDFITTEKIIAEHKLKVMDQDLEIKNSIEKCLVSLCDTLDTLRKEYNDVINNTSSCGVDREKTLTNGLDFTKGKRMRMYEKILAIVQEKIDTYKSLLCCLDFSRIETEMYRCCEQIYNCEKKLQGDKRGKMHQACKCPNIVMSNDKEECAICSEESVSLFDIRCGNKHMLCVQCITKLLDNEAMHCPFCREFFYLPSYVLFHMKQLSVEKSSVLKNSDVAKK